MSEDDCRPIRMASGSLRVCGFQLGPRACGLFVSAAARALGCGVSVSLRNDSQSALLQLDSCTFMVFVLPENGISLRAFAGQWRVAVLAEEALAFPGEQMCIYPVRTITWLVRP